MARRPVAAVLHDLDLVVVCDDGTVWTHQREADAWLQNASIPGTPAMKEKKQKKGKKDKKERKAAMAALPLK